MFINKLWRNNDVTLTTLHCVSYSVGSLHLLGSSFGTLENICTKFTHISQKWFYFSVHYTFYLHIILGRRNWLRCRGRFFMAHTVFHCRNSVKNCFPCKISLKLGNWLPSYGQKRFSLWCVSTIFNFKNVHIYCLAVIEFQVCCCIPNLIRIEWYFVVIWRFIHLQYGGHLPRWTFEIYSFCHVTSIAVLFCFPVQNFTEIRNLMAKKDVKYMR